MFQTNGEFDTKHHSTEELEVIDAIISRYKNISTWDLVEISHTEKGWMELHGNKGIIS